MEEYDYFRIIIGENDELIVLFKKKEGREYKFSTTYKFDQKTRELTAEIGVFGFTCKQKTIIENGSFTITMPILSRQLIMIFEVK